MQINEKTGHSYDWTCVAIANQLGDDYPPAPVPVHTSCYEKRGVSGGYERVVAAKRFIPLGTKAWAGPSLPADTRCWFCREVI